MSSQRPPVPIPPRPTDEKKPRSGTLAIVLASIAGLIVFAGLFVLLAQIAIALMIGLVLLLLLAAFHYLVWGHWVGDSIRREVEEEEERQGK